MTGILYCEPSFSSESSKARRWGRVAVSGGVIASVSRDRCRVYQSWRNSFGHNPPTLTLTIESNELTSALYNNSLVIYRDHKYSCLSTNVKNSIIKVTRSQEKTCFTSCYTITEVIDGETRIFFPGHRLFGATRTASLLLPQSFDTVLTRLIQGGIVDIATEWRKP